MPRDVNLEDKAKAVGSGADSEGKVEADMNVDDDAISLAVNVEC